MTAFDSRKSQSKTVEFDAEGEVTEDPRARNSDLDENLANLRNRPLYLLQPL